MTWWDVVAASPLLMALFGAVVGGMRAGVMSWTKNGFWRALTDGLIGVVFALSMADWLTPPQYPKLAALIGLLAGTIGARALDATAELVPGVMREFWRELVLGWARKITGGSGQRPQWQPPREPPYRGPIDNPDGGPHEHR